MSGRCDRPKVAIQPVENLAVGSVSDVLARRVFERTGGNPFFLEQVCSALLEQGAVATTTAEAVVEGGAEALSLPDTVQEVWGRESFDARPLGGTFEEIWGSGVVCSFCIHSFHSPRWQKPQTTPDPPEGGIRTRTSRRPAAHASVFSWC